MLSWLRGLSDTKQGLVVAVALGLIVVSLLMLVNLLA